jgi:hypothetical protein
VKVPNTTPKRIQAAPKGTVNARVATATRRAAATIMASHVMGRAAIRETDIKTISPRHRILLPFNTKKALLHLYYNTDWIFLSTFAANF